MGLHNNYYWKTAGLGAIAGIRSLAATAILSHELSKTPKDILQRSPLRYLQSWPVATGLKYLAATEIAGDKVPGAPDRIVLPSLLVRTASGALIGAAIFTANRDNGLKGALIGALSAVAVTYGSFYLRKSVNNNTKVPDTVLGFIEDAIMLSSGIAITKS